MTPQQYKRAEPQVGDTLLLKSNVTGQLMALQLGPVAKRNGRVAWYDLSDNNVSLLITEILDAGEIINYFRFVPENENAADGVQEKEAERAGGGIRDRFGSAYASARSRLRRKSK